VATEVTEDFRFWVTYGYRHGYLSEPFCWTHGSVPLSPEESVDDLLEEDPPCITAVRLYPQ
jgi:hypothetical protein